MHRINDAVLGQNHNPTAIDNARRAAHEQTGNKVSPRFFECMLQMLREDPGLDLRRMDVGVTAFTGEFYHDLFFIASLEQ